MTQAAERSVFVLVIVALGGLVAGLVISFQMLARAVPVAAAGEPASTPTLYSCIEAPAAEPATVLLQESTFTAGAPIHFSISAGPLGENAWVGVIPSSIEHGSDTRNDEHDVTYAYVESGTTGELTAPLVAGSYDLRLHDRYPDGQEIASVTIEVVASSSAVHGCRYPIHRQ